MLESAYLRNLMIIIMIMIMIMMMMIIIIIIVIIITVQRPRTKNTENVADENRSDPCGRWCAWYSKEGMVETSRKYQRESYCDRDPKDLHAAICANPQEGP